MGVNMITGMNVCAGIADDLCIFADSVTLSYRCAGDFVGARHKTGCDHVFNSHTSIKSRGHRHHIITRIKPDKIAHLFFTLRFCQI